MKHLPLLLAFLILISCILIFACIYYFLDNAFSVANEASRKITAVEALFISISFQTLTGNSRFYPVNDITMIATTIQGLITTSMVLFATYYSYVFSP